MQGEKQINRSQRGSWTGRCAGAGLRNNDGPMWGPIAWEKITSTPANDVFMKYSSTAAKAAEADRCRKAGENARLQRKRSKYSNDNSAASRQAYSRHDGDSESNDSAFDLPAVDLQDMMIQFYKTNVMINNSSAGDIQQATMKHHRDHQSLGIWCEERRLRVTSSNVGLIVRHRDTTPVTPLVHQLVQSNFRGNKATTWGINQEEGSKIQYLAYIQQHSPNITVNSECGLVVSLDHPWLAATPDGFVHDPCESPPHGLVEFKNPHYCKDQQIEKAITDKKIKFLVLKNGKTELKRSHQYHYQVQAAMLCTGKQWYDFCVRTTVDFRVERVYFDQQFCNGFIQKVHHFYFNSILSQLTHHRTVIREPQWITNMEEWDHRVRELTMLGMTATALSTD